jgi:P2-related tail formation protein
MLESVELGNDVRLASLHRVQAIEHMELRLEHHRWCQRQLCVQPCTKDGQTLTEYKWHNGHCVTTHCILVIGGSHVIDEAL